MRALERDRDALHLATLVNLALVRPERLADEQARLTARERELTRGAGAAESGRAAAQQRMQEMLARLRDDGVYDVVVGAS